MKQAALILALVLGLVALLFLSRWQRTRMVRALPPIAVCESRTDALNQAGPGAIPVLGTGSMAPYIPAAPVGQDPMTTVVAYVVLSSSAPFEKISTGDLIIYKPIWSKGPVMHQAALHDSGGWIADGLHNKGSESRWRVTAADYLGTVNKVYTWK